MFCNGSRFLLPQVFISIKYENVKKIDIFSRKAQVHLNVSNKSNVSSEHQNKCLAIKLDCIAILQRCKW